MPQLGGHLPQRTGRWDRGFESQRMRLQSKDQVCGSGRSVRAAEWEVPVGLLSKGPATSLFGDHYHMK